LFLVQSRSVPASADAHASTESESRNGVGGSRAIDKVKTVGLAGDFFDNNEINSVMGIDSAATIWAWIETGASVPVTGSATPVPRGGNVVYRGQATASHGLSSSLYRLCREINGITVVEADLANAEMAIIQAMREEGLGRLMTDGERAKAGRRERPEAVCC
jgi:hypothetical protein